MRSSVVALGALAVIGCGSDGKLGIGGNDLAMSLPDLATRASDLAVPRLGPDLAFGTNTDGAVGCVPASGASAVKLVWNTMQMPLQRSDYAIDLNGDGRVDNALGNIDGALAAQNLDPQSSATMALANGQSITLLEERSTDPTFQADACAAALLYDGQTTASPDYSGAGKFTVDGSNPPGQFEGPIASGRLTSAPPPATARVPSVVHLALPIGSPVPSLVEVIGARLTFTYAGGRVSGGQLNGAVRKEQIDDVIVPNLATLLTLEITLAPTSSQAMQIAAIFDTGGTAQGSCAPYCQNRDGSCAKPNDGRIDPCEVATNSIIQNVLAPDVQMFDAAGNYHPNPANTAKDSLSIGVGFTAVPASF
jgi:hypothetical protein